jgi:steroid delta-isomerase-like uncharacterized protein
MVDERRGDPGDQGDELEITGEDIQAAPVQETTRTRSTTKRGTSAREREERGFAGAEVSGGPGSSQDNKVIAQTTYQAFNARDLGLATSFDTDTVEWVNLPFGATFRGRAGHRQYLENWARGFPDGKVEIRNVIAERDWVVVEFTGRGTHQGPLAGPAGEIAPTGRRVEVPFCDVFQFENGRIVRGRTYFDAATLMRQLGLLPEGAAAQSTASSSRAG